MKDDLGDRLKSYEAVETQKRLDPTLPVYARIDGRGFSKFTRGMRRPYDENMRRAMVDTTRYLVNTTNARIGYTQSDEISLIWWVDGSNPLEQMFFDAKLLKLTSVLSSMATAAFTAEVLESPDVEFQRYAVKRPHFDARVFNVPSLDEGANCFVWREQDAVRNAISMTAQSLYSHTQLQGKKQADMARMIAEQGIAYDDEFPAGFRRGTYVRRELVERPVTDIPNIPEHLRHTMPQTVIRSEVVEMDMPPITTVKNRVDVIFHGRDPEV